MCGINGFITKTDNHPNNLAEQIHAMNDRIVHRGPDEGGTFTYPDELANVALGMRRLSIIDLSSGSQPIFSDDNQKVIVFNGEIYNYREIREQLRQKQVVFKTKSDTEVILRLYEMEGEEAFGKLDGMFAFSIYDKTRDKMFIARDFFGEKPLYYTDATDQFMWASELKSMVDFLSEKPKVSKKGLNHFLRLTYIPAPYTIYENIYKLEANHYITYDLKSHTYTVNEINTSKTVFDGPLSFQEAKKKTRELVLESIESRSISDVPLGTFLSGGVDSSIVSLCLSELTDKKIDTFSIGFKKASFDETDKSRIVAKLINSNHHEFIIDEDDLKDNIHEILLNFDEPFSDTAALPTYLVSKKTRDYVKVALTGDGGDEVFGGYNKYYVGKLNNRYTSIVPEALHGLIRKASNVLLTTKDDKRGKRFKVRKMVEAVNYKGDYYWDIISLGNTENQLKDLILPDKFETDLFAEYRDKLGIQKPKTLNDFRTIDRALSLEGGMLAKVDRTSMLCSLECRAPFLNKKLWDFTLGLPENFLMQGWNKKYILKEAFKGSFPNQFLEKSKQGFGSPVGDWLKSSLRAELESYILPKFLESQELFNVENTTRLVKDHLSNKKDSTYSVWAFYCFQKWYVNMYERSYAL